MRLEQFFDKFEQFADAPNAVGKMRELILHLAVHGKLVEQLEGDEPAIDLLSQSRVEMARLMALGKAKREKPAEPVSEGEVAFSLPRGWVWCRLVDAGQFINGLAFKPSDWGVVGRPIIRIQNLSGRNSEFNRAAGDFDPSVIVQDGDILVSWSATLDAFIWRGEEGVLNQHIFRVLPAPLADKGYIFWLLKWVIRQLAESDHAHGLVMSHINRGPFLAHPIPLPPLAEQKRIVAKVDELMALCDRLEAQQQERDTRHTALASASLARFAEAPTPANLDFLFHNSYPITPADLRKSILTLAVQGRLAPQDPSDESASNSLRVAGVDLGRWAVADDEQRFATPESWVWMRFAGVGDQRLGKMLDAHKNRGEPKPYLRNTNVQWMRFELDDVKEMRVEKDEEEELRLQRGDLLICEGGEPGRCAIWNERVPEMYFQKALHRVRPCTAILPEYLALNLQIDCQNNVLAGLFTGATIKHLTGRSLSQYPVPIPPLAEQRRIVAKVEQLMALVDWLETQLATSRVTTEKLMEAVVSELTTQD